MGPVFLDLRIIDCDVLVYVFGLEVLVLLTEAKNMEDDQLSVLESNFAKLIEVKVTGILLNTRVVWVGNLEDVPHHLVAHGANEQDGEDAAICRMPLAVVVTISEKHRVAK